MLSKAVRIQKAVMAVLDWVSASNVDDVRPNKQEIVDVCKNALGQSSDTTAHNLIDFMVSFQYMNEYKEGRDCEYSLTVYGANLLDALQRYFDGE